MNHEAWYKIYLNLREKQRSAIKEWRKRKEIEKTKKIGEDEAATEEAAVISRVKSNPDVTEKLPPGAANKRETKTTTPGEVVDVESANQKKELIRQWKAERENKRLMEEQRYKTLTESKLAAQEKRKQERLKKVRATLTEYHERKLTELTAKQSKDDFKTERKCDPAMMEAFR